MQPGLCPTSDTTLCLKKNIPDIFDCNLKTNYQIWKIFGTNIPDTVLHPCAVQTSVGRIGAYPMMLF